jgi:parallel beta helix pectate lyase-like protein
MKTLGYAVILLLSFAGPLRAAQVYSGCSIPSATPRHVWYIDPVHGKSPAAGGNGSQASPWNSLSGVIDGHWGTIGFSVPGYTRPLLSSVPYFHTTSAGRVDVADQLGNPPVQPGDTIYLMSGNYGDVGVGIFNIPTSNSDFVTVEAAPIPGQVPVFSTLYILSTNKWVFDGIEVQSLLGTNNNTNALVTITDQGASLPTTDIILENMQISSAASTAGWSKAQWVAQARTGYYEDGRAGNGTNGEPYTSCISMAGSHIQNVRNGAIIAGNNTLFTNSVIDHFGDDGIDYAASNLAITHNYIHDNLDIGDGNHEDAMQGQNGPLPAGVAYNAFSNILIDSNLILRQTDPALSFPTYLQGIDAFDEDWTNMTITNNVVVTSACWGIAFGSIHNSLVANNTVVDDGFGLAPGCIAAVSVGGKTSEGPLSTNTVVRNNLASQIDVDNRDTGVEADHNVGMCCKGPELSWYVNGVMQFISQTGTYPNGNIIDAGGTKSEFLNFNPSTLTYTLFLKSGAPAISAGTAGAPTVDILGVSRTATATATATAAATATATASYTAGAYSYPY